MKNRIKGFTLVEVLIGLTLVGLILAITYSGLFAISRSWAVGEKRFKSSDAFRQSVTFIKRQLGQAIPLMVIGQDSNAVLFRGNKNSVDYIAKLPSHFGGHPLYLATFQLRKNPDNNSSLVFVYQPLKFGKILYEKNADSIETVLLDDISEFALSYYGKESALSKAAWHEEWINISTLPEYVRINAKFNDASIIWPEMVIKINSQFVQGLPQQLVRIHDG